MPRRSDDYGGEEWFARNARPAVGARTDPKRCSIDGCIGISSADGLCDMHWFDEVDREARGAPPNARANAPPRAEDKPADGAEADLRTLLTGLGDLEFEQQREERKTRPRRDSGLELWTPEPWPDEVDGRDVLDDLAAAVRTFVVIDDAGRDASALWTLHAHAHEAAAISPILLITAPARGCGKSTLLDLIGRLAPRPLTSAASTAAALYRTAEQRPTILCDEGDTYLGEDRRLVAFFNAGHRRGVPFRVCEGDDNHVKAYPSWAPKAIAMIGVPRDATIADRSIRVALQRKGGHDEAEDFSSTRPYPELRDLARRCARWAADHLDELRNADPELPLGFANRLADNWRALLACAELAGGDWPRRARAAALAIGELPDSDLGTMLLADLQDVFGAADLPPYRDAGRAALGAGRAPLARSRGDRGRCEADPRALR